MNSKALLIAVIVVMAALAVYLYPSLDDILVFCMSKAFNLDVAYSELGNKNFREFDFSNLRVTDKRRGLGLAAGRARFLPKWSIRSWKEFEVDFSLSNVKFLMNGSAGRQSYNDLTALVAAPFKGNWTYSSMSGKVKTFDQGIDITRFSAIGDDMKLFVNGKVYYNNSVDTDIDIHFSGRVVKRMPKELTDVVLKDEGPCWKSLSVHLKGNYASPSIQILGRLFRLTIGK